MSGFSLRSEGLGWAWGCWRAARLWGQRLQSERVGRSHLVFVKGADARESVMYRRGEVQAVGGS